MNFFSIPEPSPLLEVGFYLFAATIGGALPWVTWRVTREKRTTLLTGLGVLLWIAFTGALTLWEGFRGFQPPPPMALTLILGSTIVISLVFSPLGTRLVQGLSLAGLILFQSFRLPLEMLMHRAYIEGLMPIQMSYEGRNLDILTGLGALLLGLILLKRPLPKGWVWAWNLAGFALLVNIVTVAILSMPAPWRQFSNDPPNVWVFQMPFIWLPMVMVMAALFGHLAVARKLLGEAEARP